MDWYVEAVYPMTPDYKEHEKHLSVAAGYPAEGGGSDFSLRDLCWTHTNEKAAHAMANDLRAVDVPGLIVTVFSG